MQSTACKTLVERSQSSHVELVCSTQEGRSVHIMHKADILGLLTATGEDEDAHEMPDHNSR